MEQAEKRKYLIKTLLAEQLGYKDMEIPEETGEQKRLLRSLFNVRMPGKINGDFLKVQDEYLQEVTKEKGIMELKDLTPAEEGIYLWQGDITTLRCDAIVNAANSGMTGCYQPCHNCIDNCIHTYAGIQLRNACADIMEMQGYEEPTAPKPVYEHLLSLVKDKDYFVITTNVDHCFQKAGFDKSRLFYTQGDYGLFQCSEPCSDVTYENEEMVRNMVEQQKDMKIPKDLIPKCPKCGKPLTMNLRSDDKFVEDKGWHEAAARYRDFLHSHDGKILYLELGVGYNTPAIIKYPFWQMTADNPYATYACVNYGEAICPEDIREQAICIDGDIGIVIDELRK